MALAGRQEATIIVQGGKTVEATDHKVVETVLLDSYNQTNINKDYDANKGVFLLVWNAVSILSNVLIIYFNVIISSIKRSSEINQNSNIKEKPHQLDIGNGLEFNM